MTRLMMRLMLAGLALIAAAPAPAAAQTSELPVWMVGTWCWDRIIDLCVRYEAPENGGMAVWRQMPKDGQTNWAETARMTIEDGRLVLRGASGKLLSREVSRGPNMLLLEPERTGSSGQALQIRYTLSGDMLTMEFILDGGRPPAIQRYKRVPNAGARPGA